MGDVRVLAHPHHASVGRLAQFDLAFIVSSPRRASLIVLTARQVGKTTTAAWAMLHTAIYYPGSLSVIVCPVLQQSAEALRRVRDCAGLVGAELVRDNVYGLEFANGARVLALPASDDSIRGKTVDGWIVVDEAARLSPELMAALRPMRARTQARFAMLSTALSRTDPFWQVWAGDDPSWIRLQATADMADIFTPERLEEERRAMGEAKYQQEYLGIPDSDHASPFGRELFTQASTPPPPSAVAVGSRSVRSGGGYNIDLPATWPALHPQIIAHDVGRVRDRSTAVVGGGSPFKSAITGLVGFEELPQGLYGSARANALAAVDRRYAGPTLIVADLSNEASYGEFLFETFGPRVIDVQISRSGEGMSFERREVRNGMMLIYNVGRTFLIDQFHSLMANKMVRWVPGPAAERAYAQLADLKREIGASSTIYSTLPGYHDDLAISCCMVAWAARHPHLPAWLNAAFAYRATPPTYPKISSGGWT